MAKLRVIEMKPLKGRLISCRFSVGCVSEARTRKLIFYLILMVRGSVCF
jgi:hypothetical protein